MLVSKWQILCTVPRFAPSQPAGPGNTSAVEPDETSYNHVPRCEQSWFLIYIYQHGSCMDRQVHGSRSIDRPDGVTPGPAQSPAHRPPLVRELPPTANYDLRCSQVLYREPVDPPAYCCDGGTSCSALCQPVQEGVLLGSAHQLPFDLKCLPQPSSRDLASYLR